MIGITMIDEKQRIYLRLRLHIRCSNTVFDQGEAVHRDPRGELENSKHFGRKLSALQGSDIVVYKDIRCFCNNSSEGVFINVFVIVYDVYD